MNRWALARDRALHHQQITLQALRVHVNQLGSAELRQRTLTRISLGAMS